MSVFFMFGWGMSFALLAVVAHIRQLRYRKLLARAYPDSAFGRYSLGTDDRPVAPWEAIQRLRDLQIVKRNEIPAHIREAQQIATDAWRAASISLFGGMALIVLVIELAPHTHPPRPEVGAVLMVMLAAGLALTSTILARAIRTPAPARFQYLLGACLCLAASIGFAWSLSS